MATNDLTAQRLRELLDYDPDTGLFTWRISLGIAKAGDVPRCFQRYYVLQIDGKRYLQHRLAWLHVHGEWPKHTIDHINQDERDNRLVNLRDVSRSVNNQNRGPMSKPNSHLPTGVTPTLNGRFSANIRIGVFDTVEAAESAYLKLKRAIHSGFLG